MNNRRYYVYILSNFTRTVLYIGVTNDLVRRVWEHKNSVVEGFTKKYQVHELLYYEPFENPEDAITREKQIKAYSRKHKQKIILASNPKLLDLYESITNF